MVFILPSEKPCKKDTDSPHSMLSSVGHWEFPSNMAGRFYCPCGCTSPKGNCKYFMSVGTFTDHMYMVHKRGVKFHENMSFVTFPIGEEPPAPATGPSAPAPDTGATMQSVMASPEFLAMVATLASSMVDSANAIVKMDVAKSESGSSDGSDASDSSESDEDFIPSMEEEDDDHDTVSFVDSSVSVSFGRLGISMKDISEDEKAIALKAGMEAIKRMREIKEEKSALMKKIMKDDNGNRIIGKSTDVPRTFEEILKQKKKDKKELENYLCSDHDKRLKDNKQEEINEDEDSDEEEFRFSAGLLDKLLVFAAKHQEDDDILEGEEERIANYTAYQLNLMCYEERKEELNRLNEELKSLLTHVNK